MNENMMTITRRTLNVLKNAMIPQEYKTEEHKDMTYEERDDFSKVWRYANKNESIKVYRTPRNKGVTLCIKSLFELHGIITVDERTPDDYVCLSTRNYNWIKLRIIEDTEVSDQ